jgi:hypothetical protein
MKYEEQKLHQKVLCLLKGSKKDSNYVVAIKTSAFNVLVLVKGLRMMELI